MTIQFQERENGPERLVTEAEIHFDEGALAGMKLVGFGVLRSPEGELYVTFPSRAFGAGAERRFFDYLRSKDGAGETVRSVKAWILSEYRRRRGESSLGTYPGGGGQPSPPRSRAGERCEASIPEMGPAGVPGPEVSG
jgi:hypothetical protein